MADEKDAADEGGGLGEGVQESRNSICKVTEGAGRGPHTGHALEIENVCYS